MQAELSYFNGEHMVHKVQVISAGYLKKTQNSHWATARIIVNIYQEFTLKIFQNTDSTSNTQLKKIPSI